jgi:lysophospholipase L1-like esterase
VCNFDTLSPWFAKVVQAERMPGRVPLHILQIGDSHTAGDVTTSGWRTLLRARFGSGGRGVLAPGRPYNGYLTQGVTASMSPGWSVAASFGKGSALPRPPLGVASYSLTADMAGSRLGLTADDADDTFDRVVVCALQAPGAGGVTIDLGDGLPVHLALDAMVTTPKCETVRSVGLRSAVSIVTDGGPVTLTSIATFRDGGGVVLSNLGVVGSQLSHFARTSDAVVAEELRVYRPDLIVLAFGTNEGFSPRFDATAYAVLLAGQIGRLRRLSGGVPILLLGAPDALSRQPALRFNADEIAVGCPETPAALVPVASIGVVTAPLVRAPLFAPPGLAAVRDVQRMVAWQVGVAWWDWQARMGGACAAQKWVAGDLMRRDYVHFKSAGGRIIARALQDDLDVASGIR